jgi:maltose O-acetyltransferase
MKVTGHLLRFRRRLLGQRDVDYYRSKGARIGDDVQLGPESWIDPPMAYLVTIGDDVVIAPRVTIIAHDASMRRRKGLTKLAPVTIGSRVFIGAGALILPGVTIGDGAIVGAGSVVTRDIPEGMLAVGNPARAVRPRSELEDQFDLQVLHGPRYNETTPGALIPESEWETVRKAVEAAGYGWAS